MTHGVRVAMYSRSPSNLQQFKATGSDNCPVVTGGRSALQAPVPRTVSRPFRPAAKARVTFARHRSLCAPDNQESCGGERSVRPQALRSRAPLHSNKEDPSVTRSVCSMQRCWYLRCRKKFRGKLTRLTTIVVACRGAAASIPARSVRILGEFVCH